MVSRVYDALDEDAMGVLAAERDGRGQLRFVGGRGTGPQAKGSKARSSHRSVLSCFRAQSLFVKGHAVPGWKDLVHEGRLAAFG